MKVYYALLTFLFPSGTHADIKWPLYSQQCRDDAGTPFMDDEAIYGPNGFYHDKSAAYPVLQDGKCPQPLEQACKDRPTYKAAFLEGPIDCGDNGWYCRIMPDENWPPVNLSGDVNFGHCNTTDGFEDAGYDQDGHCHGSSHDSTYYWWVRDHFFRRYNGRLRCCCGWYDGTSSTPLYGRRIANRCDYRRLVTETENLENCRDANEGHGLGFDNIGCDPAFKASQLNKPIPEDDGICWEVQRFGKTDEEYDIPTANPAGAPTASPVSSAPIKSPTVAPNASPLLSPAPVKSSPPTALVASPAPTASNCSDSTLKFKVRINGRVRFLGCRWVKKNLNRCNKDGASEACPQTCGTCSVCEDTPLPIQVIRPNGSKIYRTCDWANSWRCNKFDGLPNTCRRTCGICQAEDGDEYY